MSNILNALSYGGIVAVIGMLIVFLGLIILIAFIWAMAKIFDKINADAAAKKQAAEAAAAKAAAEAAAKAVEAAVPAPVEEPAVEDVTDDAELIAVIAAAIAAFDNSGKALVVRKVRRVNAWNKSAREEQICRF